MFVTEQIANLMKIHGDVITEDGVDYRVVDAYPIYDGCEVEIEYLSLDGNSLMYKRLSDVSDGVTYRKPTFEEEEGDDCRFVGDEYADLLR